MAVTAYPLDAGKYGTYSASNDKDKFDDASSNPYDFSQWKDLCAQLVFITWTGSPTSLDVDIETSAYNSDDDNDWTEILSFTQITSSSATSEVSASDASCVMNYCRIRITFSGGSSPTWTGYVYAKSLGLVTS